MVRTPTALILPLVLTLAACATPREACIASAEAPLREVTRDIAQTERALDRGYRLVRVRDIRLALTRCVTRNRDGERVSYPCQRPTTVTRSEPVGIDYSEERARLKRLRAEQTRLLPQVERGIRQCQISYPPQG
ncbi:hypothetical protein ILP92_00940 [Maribius pontilimi]|uniref:Lipoprotein n=1 Tax=Palleronia pontilimi TaxID=1964209 RepID=A0A934IBA7_9RHOB|nr:hypothetical protein [Palleronia pontilimi]MBJ3761317.1 hypothetical protein [Palleronia pontilimi]